MQLITKPSTFENSSSTEVVWTLPNSYVTKSIVEAASDRGPDTDKKKKLDMAVGKRRMTYCSCEEPNFDQTRRGKEGRVADLA